MHQRQPPQMTQEVPADGSCFFRLYPQCMFCSLFLIIWHGVFGKYATVSVLISAISSIVTGAVNEAPKLRSLRVEKMRQVWETDIFAQRAHPIKSGSFANGDSNIVGHPTTTGSFHSRTMLITRVPSTCLQSFSL